MWHTALQIWNLLARMAPYLLGGFLVAGVLHVWVRREFIEKHLGRKGLPQIIKATLFGIPLPLCSCSVIPVSASLRQHGAGKGATAAFLVSTPQTGVDSMAATWALLGPLFTVVRVVVALISGLLAGLTVDRVDGDDDGPPAATAEPHCEHCEAARRHWSNIFRYGFLRLPADIGKPLLVGVVIAGLVSALAPPDLLMGAIHHPFWMYVGAMAVAVPLYVCATASIPLAVSLIHLGFSPGAALVFLIAGPATNGATISTLWSSLGPRTVVAYLVSILVTACAAGIGLDLLARQMPLLAEIEHGMAPALWQQAAGALLVALIAYASIREKRSQNA